ncbi:MAG TPA: divergent polysaccharide deacetylase family protein [Deltaproteobacteria bacterium]|nr:divergent polysaccharide deacetylase family protein [Deltaproteobacteria bacterium]HQB39910.1 divergent polysaccharide deacetylase family protein [Deltaproteobacteria bacterium]
MAKPKQNRYSQGQGGGRYAALAFVVIVLLAVGGYLLFGNNSRQTESRISPPAEKTSVPSARPVQQPLTPTAPPVQQLPQAQEYKPEPRPPVDLPLVPGSEKPSGAARMAVIIDDMGAGMQEARALAGIGVPLTFAIIPGLHHVRDVAAFAPSKGIEVMIHMPMQSKEWPKRRLESNGLLVGMSDDEIRERIEGYLRDIPGAVGANNHMGSEFTEHEDKMRVVLSVLKGKGLYFIDSVTSSRSIGTRVAAGMGVRSGRRHVFLDNEQNMDYIKGQLEQAVRLAKRNGAAIAICHPHPATIKTLGAVLPGLKERGITLVHASALVR